MPMRREQVAAALKYLGDKADLRGRAERALSLDPQEQDLADLAVETGASFIPGVGQALAARDVERARRANDPAGMAMAAASAIPGERLAKLLKGFDPTRLELDVYHGTPHRFPATETVNVYRGENAANMGGNYWSTNPEFAQQFTQRGLPKEVKRSTLSMSDVYSPPTPVFAGDAKAVDAAIAEAKKLGKSAVRFSEGKNQPDSFFVIEKAALGRKGNPLGEFDASKIGTGEGAQAYGKGIYFTESPDVAKGYQPRDPKAEAKLMNLYKQAEARQNYNAMEVLEAAMLHRTADELREQFPRQKGLVGRIAKIQEQSPSSLYKADLPDEMIDRMLDYDKPINEHSQVVLDALERAGINTQSAMRAGQMIEGQEAHLAKFGIPGMIYREGRGKGPRNFVVFPGEEKKVRILERK